MFRYSMNTGVTVTQQYMKCIDQTDPNRANDLEL